MMSDWDLEDWDFDESDDDLYADYDDGIYLCSACGIDCDEDEYFDNEGLCDDCADEFSE